MKTSLSSKVLTPVNWMFNKTMRVAIQGLHVDLNSVAMVKSLLKENKKVILVPVYKSFADPFILNFIHSHFKFEIPFSFGNFEDTPQIPFFRKLGKSTGYIFSRRADDQDLQSQYINSALLKEIIKHNNLSVVYQNSTRPRTGKFN